MRFNLRSILELILFVGIYLAMFDADSSTMFIATVVVPVGTVRFCRYGLSLPQTHAAVVGVVASSLHCGVLLAVSRAHAAFDHPLKDWASWRYGGGWPSVIGHALHGAYVGLILGLTVVVGFLFFSRLTQETSTLAKRFIATTTWLLGTCLGTVGTIKLSDFILDFFYARAGWLSGLGACALAGGVGFVLVWTAFAPWLYRR